MYQYYGSAPNAGFHSASGSAYLPTYGVISQFGASKGGRTVTVFRAAAAISSLGGTTVISAAFTNNITTQVAKGFAIPTPTIGATWQPGPWKTFAWIPDVPIPWTTSRLAFSNGLFDQAAYVDGVYTFHANNNGPGKASGLAVTEGGHLSGGTTSAQLQAGINGTGGINFTNTLMVAAYPPSGGGTKVQLDAVAARSGSLGMNAYDFVNAKWVNLSGALFGPNVPVNPSYTTLTFPRHGLGVQLRRSLLRNDAVPDLVLRFLLLPQLRHPAGAGGRGHPQLQRDSVASATGVASKSRRRKGTIT
jgi:hypothetical protein